MITEQELKEQCTPEIIKKMVELAEGFEYSEEDLYGWFNNRREGFSIHSKYNENRGIKGLTDKILMFSTLIHRAIEGWNKKRNANNTNAIIYIKWSIVEVYMDNDYIDYRFDNYQSENLTACECAILDCLIELLK